MKQILEKIKKTIYRDKRFYIVMSLFTIFTLFMGQEGRIFSLVTFIIMLGSFIYEYNKL